jgi:hypothetical protein
MRLKRGIVNLGGLSRSGPEVLECTRTGLSDSYVYV